MMPGCIQDLELQQAEQKAKQSGAAGGVDSRALQLQQDLIMTRQQLTEEQAKLMQLQDTSQALQRKAALSKRPSEAASLQAR